MEEHIDLLGMPARDKVTGLAGVITSVCFDLYGCVQAVITPSVNDKGEVTDGRWFDVTRIEITSDIRVMDLPDYSAGYIAQGKKGAADKPLP